jgi:hypothetical protein
MKKGKFLLIAMLFIIAMVFTSCTPESIVVDEQSTGGSGAVILVPPPLA